MEAPLGLLLPTGPYGKARPVGPLGGIELNLYANLYVRIFGSRVTLHGAGESRPVSRDLTTDCYPGGGSNGIVII